MSHEISSNLLVIVSLVASALVFLYALGYFAILYSEKQRGKLRWDWHISTIFYLGILAVTLAHMITVLHFCGFNVCSDLLSDPLYVIGLLLFVVGFEKRAKASEKLTNKMWQKPKKSRR